MSDEDGDRLPDWPERQLLYTAIGQGISFWADMESNIVVICAKLLRSDTKKVGLILYSITNTNMWLTIVTELFALDEKYSDLAGKWNKIAERIKAQNDTRVRLAHHSKWFAPAEEIALRSSPYDWRAKWRNSSPLQTREIGAFVGKVAEIADDLGNLISEMEGMNPQPPLPGIFNQLTSLQGPYRMPRLSPKPKESQDPAESSEG